MRIALLGGSFDPVHFGHLMIADAAVTRLGYDAVVFVPAAVSPHKKDARPASPDDRLAMLNAAVLGDRRFLVDDCELRRKGVSFTIDTIEDLEERYRPEGRIGLIIGEDLVAGFSTWRRVDELVARVDIVLATRPGGQVPDFAYPHTKLENAPMDISSTSARALIAEGSSWRYLVPASSRRIIEERGLYGCLSRKDDALESLSDAVERFAFESLSPSRYLHSRGVAQLAGELCARFGMDARKGYLAGIAHDVCKEMSSDRIIALAVLDGAPLSSVERDKPALLHARAAANFLESRFGCRDESVLNAIRHHTFGECGMDDLSKAVYIADKIEPSRKSVSSNLRDKIRRAPLGELFAATLEDTIRYLRERGKLVSERTELLMAECRETGNESRRIAR